MEYRAGKCSSCGAEYKIPASFAHDVARCKECSGVVNIGKLGEPAPTAVAKPVPARKVAPTGDRKPNLEEHVPSGKKGGGPSMMEKLRAQRAAEAAAAGQAPEKPAPKAAPTPKRTPVAAGAKREAPAAAKTRPGAGTRPARGSSRRRGKDEEGEDGAPARGGRRKFEKPEKKFPMGGVIGIVAIVVLCAVGYFFRDALFGGGASADETTKTANIPSETTPDATTDGAADEGTAEDTTPADEVKPAEVPEEKPVKEPVDPKEMYNPDKVDLSVIPDYGPVFDTTPEEWAKMNEDMLVWMDPDAGAAGSRAGKRIQEYKLKAMPVILNHMKTLELGTPDGHSNGDVINRAIMQMLYGTNFDWQYPDQKPDSYEYFNKTVVQKWAGQWDKVLDSGIEYWIKMGSMDKEGVGPEGKGKDPKEAARLRKLYANMPVVAGSGGAVIQAVTDDEFEVD